MSADWKTKILVKDLQVAFGLTDAELNAHVVRLSVLYEDLKIELTGSGGPSIPRLEFYGKSARQQYFIRRTFATLYEFRECFDRLDKCAEFEHVKQRINQDSVAAKRWSDCVQFFRENEKIITDQRHDFGGHFGEKASRAVIKELAGDPNTIIGELEFNRDFANARAGMHLRYAEEIAAQAMHRHRGKLTHAEWREKLFTTARAAFEHAAQAVHVIVIYYVWDRFR
jgi:hypothetical protein